MYTMLNLYGLGCFTLRKANVKSVDFAVVYVSYEII